MVVLARGTVARALRQAAGALSPRRRARAGTWWMDVSLGECFRPSRWEGRLVGLLGTREERAPALVLAPCASIHTFGMGYPIDVAFVGPDGRALRACVGVPPGRVVSCRGSRWVLERPHRGGWWFEEGDVVAVGPDGYGARLGR